MIHQYCFYNLFLLPPTGPFKLHHIPEICKAIKTVPPFQCMNSRGVQVTLGQLGVPLSAVIKILLSEWQGRQICHCAQLSLSVCTPGEEEPGRMFKRFQGLVSLYRENLSELYKCQKVCTFYMRLHSWLLSSTESCLDATSKLIWCQGCRQARPALISALFIYYTWTKGTFSPAVYGKALVMAALIC